MQPLKELTLLMLSSVFGVSKGVIVPAKSTCSHRLTCHLLFNCVSALPQEQPASSTAGMASVICPSCRHETRGVTGRYHWLQRTEVGLA
jgi:hypothetical protein